MYKKTKPNKTVISANTAVIGETIEKKVVRIMINKEPVTATGENIFTERKEGVLPQYNPKADKWEAAVVAMDKVAQRHQGNRIKKENPIKTGEKEATGGE